MCYEASRTRRNCTDAAYHVLFMRALLVLMGETSQETVAAKGAEEVKGDDTEVGEFEASWFEVEAGLRRGMFVHPLCVSS